MQCAYIRISVSVNSSRDFPLTMNMAANLVYQVVQGVCKSIIRNMGAIH